MHRHPLPRGPTRPHYRLQWHHVAMPLAAACTASACLYVFFSLFSTNFLFCGPVTMTAAAAPRSMTTATMTATHGVMNMTATPTRRNDGNRDNTRGATTATATPMWHNNRDCDTCGTTTATATPHAAQKWQPRPTRRAKTATATHTPHKDGNRGPHAAQQP
jgi:hypothetical protein